ncbi:hypothetical protein [Endozoicomonas sp. ALD040]|uniref:hypothetical protein n=1 Tax=unclassified Endozoicomonas TaxID=2644528 RepID=UPI003BAF29DE
MSKNANRKEVETPMQTFTTVFISVILIVSSPFVFAIKISEEHLKQGRQLIDDMDRRGSEFLELAERVQTIITTFGSQSIFTIIPHLVSMNESLERVFSSLSMSKAYLATLTKTVTNDSELLAKKAFERMKVSAGNPGQSVAMGRLFSVAGVSGDASFSGTFQEHKCGTLTELADKADKDSSEFSQKALSYQILNNKLKEYLDQNDTIDVSETWSYLEEINKLLNELTTLTKSFPNSFKLFLEQALTYFDCN